MPFLTLSRRGEVILRYPLKKSGISIGRDPENDIQLAGETISRSHCALKWNGKTYFIEDKSRNGTRVNNTPVRNPQPLSPSDVIAVGDWQLEYDPSSLPAVSDTIEEEKQPTLVLKYDPAEKVLTLETLYFTITPASGTCQELAIGKLPITIGGAPSNEVVVADDPYVSRNHCVIEQTPRGIVLRDTGSRNGTLWRGAKVSEQLLPPTGEFVIGKTHISYKIVERKEEVHPTRRQRCGEMLGASRAMQEVFGLVEKIAQSDATVLITGESGTGKELCSRAIHAASDRASRAFVAINCGALPPNIIESELFGHERGAFTGATSQHKGVFEQAHGGTLLLDEIGEMPAELQTRLLRVLETRVVRRVGGNTDVQIDCRIIAATNCQLQEMVSSGRFREDLYYRLYVVPIGLAPLRERPQDIEMLIDHYLALFSNSGKKAACSPAARDALRKYTWPGNVRELRNTIQRAVVMAGPQPLQPEHIVFAPARSDFVPADQTLGQKEKKVIMSALQSCKGNFSRAARQLGIARTTLTAKMKKYGIEAQPFKD